MDNSPESITSAVTKLRERAGLSLAKLAKAMGYGGASSIQRYTTPESYNGGYLKRDLVAKFEKALVGKGNPAITREEVWALAGPEFRPLLDRRLVPLPPATSSGTRETKVWRVPVVSMVAAGRLREQAGILPTDISKYIHLNDLPKGDWLALVVEGDSMNRIAPDGAVVMVNRADSVLVDGKYYVFSHEGGDATFKRYRRDPQRLQPYSTDPDFTSIPVGDDDDLYVFGRVRKVILDV